MCNVNTEGGKNILKSSSSSRLLASIRHFYLLLLHHYPIIGLSTPVSYTHLDVYKRQAVNVSSLT